jgi:chromosome segregation ATPase
MKALADAFQLKLGVAEKEIKKYKKSKDTLQRKFDSLQQEQIRKDEEIRQLRERLARMEAALDNNNDLNYDSPNEDSDPNNDINYDSPSEDDDANNDINYDSEDNDK